MNESQIKDIVNRVGTPAFIYDSEVISGKFEQMYDFLPPVVNIYYSMKANPSLGICQYIKQLTKCIEVSSLGEIECALKAGFLAENILFSGPGKTHEELLFAIGKKIKINVESIQEIKDIQQICEAFTYSASIMIRLNPNFQSSSGIKMSGVVSQFGIDMLDLPDIVNLTIKNAYIDLIGMSIYMGSQILDAEIIISNTERIIKMFIDIQEEYGIKLKKVNVGGGFGISYFDGKCLDIKVLKQGFKVIFGKFKDKLEKTEIFFESGRYLIADSGVFVTKVLYTKTIKDKNYLICDGGFNNIIVSSFFTREIRGNFPIELIKQNERIDNDKTMEYNIAGPLCSPSDVIGSKINMPYVHKDDYLIIRRVGAYGLTFSPALFISHSIPAEVFIDGEDYYIIRKKSSSKDLFKNQCPLPNKFFERKE
ncbi:MAG: diaminopimelate decarboxylase [Lachnospiraceae bacterium]|nr:diaminopimelate decarboxylase [Lachnospiraceae bacterium]